MGIVVVCRVKTVFLNCYQISLKDNSRYSAYITIYYVANQNNLHQYFLFRFAFIWKLQVQEVIKVDPGKQWKGNLKVKKYARLQMDAGTSEQASRP